ncbi:methyltransferase [Bacillus wiedmannii]|uniref:Methyltransferase n=1 Tax=Bacillus wiedmannii TaxID=1890302 RepID=A0A2C9YMV7_9BACI|nr:methyltransferase [Bacillus wiedmannii]
MSCHYFIKILYTHKPTSNYAKDNNRKKIDENNNSLLNQLAVSFSICEKGFLNDELNIYLLFSSF